MTNSRPKAISTTLDLDDRTHVWSKDSKVPPRYMTHVGDMIVRELLEYTCALSECLISYCDVMVSLNTGTGYGERYGKSVAFSGIMQASG